MWLGGTFTRKTLFNEIKLSENETIPAITPVGYEADKTRLLERVAHRITGSGNRKPWSELFFNKDFNSQLNREAIGEIGKAFDMVQNGPSAMNGQTWRLVKDGNKVHFYNVLTSKSYNSETMRWYQSLDVGISMYQFQASALDIGLDGIFVKEDPNIPTPTMFYKYYCKNAESH